MEVGKGAYVVGDVIEVKIKDNPFNCGGKYKATCQQVTDDGGVFLFDDILFLCAYEEIEDNLYRVEEFFVQKNIPIKRWADGSILRIPTVIEIYGRNNSGGNVCTRVYDTNEEGKFQWSLMRQRKNRICIDEKDNLYGWWLKNNKPDSIIDFCAVGSEGWSRAVNNMIKEDCCLGVRPAFLLA